MLKAIGKTKGIALVVPNQDRGEVAGWFAKAGHVAYHRLTRLSCLKAKIYGKPRLWEKH